jgi:uncharacterized membrane protein YbhN (UPF0104 family)
VKQWVFLAVTVLALVFLYSQLDTRALVQYLRTMDIRLLLLAVSCFGPQVVVTALRWRWMVWEVCPISLRESLRLTQAGKALNALVPSKLGETSKAYFLKTQAGLDLPTGLALVLLEKVLDVARLCVGLLVGVLLAPDQGTLEVVAALGAATILAGTGALLAAEVVQPLARRGHDIHLLVVGHVAQRQQVANLLGERGTLTGNVPHHHLPRIYASAALLLFPSEVEGWANVVMEARACGLPVLVGTGCSCPTATPDAGVSPRRISPRTRRPCGP